MASLGSRQIFMGGSAKQNTTYDDGQKWHDGANFLARGLPVALISRLPTLPTRGREPATSVEAVSVSDDTVMRCGDDRIAGEPPGSPRRDSDSVRAPTAAERADGRGRAGQAI